MDFFANLAEIAFVFLIVFLNGFFVAAEYAIVRVRSTQIEPLVQRGVKSAKLAHHIISHLDTYLSASQLGITFTSLGLGWIGEPFVSHLIRNLLELLSFIPEAWIVTLSTVIGFSLITFLLIVFGELGPRWLAILYSQKMTLRLARPLHIFYVIFRPFIWFLNTSASVLLRAIGITPVSDTEAAHSEEEMRLLLTRGRALSSVIRNISLNAMELRDRTVREVMVPRTNIVFLSTQKSIEENIAIAVENQFTRYPLCDQNLDNVLGMIHLKDLFRIKEERGSGVRLTNIKREMLFVPETMPLERILNTFLTKRVLMAIAVDEYGGTAGLVTLENVLEELVGDIRDEFDTESPSVQKISDSEFLVDGSMSLHDFARMFNVTPGLKDVVTVSGYVLHLTGHVPEKGATLRIGAWLGAVETVDARRVKTLRLKKMPAQGHTQVERHTGGAKAL
jgi:CBS domain containing-hemolysin-like protein